MEKKRYFGELEIAVLNIVRSRDKITVADVCKLLKNPRKYTTIMTVMQRLFEKGELKREKRGRQYEYWINDQQPSGQGLLHRLKEKLFGGRAVAMVSYLLEMDDHFSSEELDELESLIEKKRLREHS